MILFSCSNEDAAVEESQSNIVTLVVTISTQSGTSPANASSTTRSVITDNGDGTISTQWEVNDKVWVCYNGNSTEGKVAQAIVTSVDVNGNATITVDLEDPKTGDSPIRFGFPYNHWANNIDIHTQTGTLEDIKDHHAASLGVGVLNITDGNASLPSGVTMTPQVCIWKFRFKDGVNDITSDIVNLRITFGEDVYIITPSSQNSIYVALNGDKIGESIPKDITIRATTESGTYKISKSGVRLYQGKMYTSNNLALTKLTLDDISLQVLSSEFIYETAPFPSCHASTVLETEDGLLAAWFGGTQERNPDVCIYSSRYNGSSWSEPKLVADGIQSESLRYPCWNPVLFRQSNGNIALFYKVGSSPEEWWGEYKISVDDGATWGGQVSLADGMIGPIKNKPLQLPNGRILYPTSKEYSSNNWKVFIESSEQDFFDWRIQAIDNGEFNAIQPTLFYLNGKLEMYCRTQEGTIAKATSTDLGESWSALSGTTLPNNNSGLDGIVLDNGLRLIVCNPITGGRNKLSIMGSLDGEHWKEMLVLEDHTSGEFSYPATIRRSDGTMEVTYTYKREKIKHMRIKILEK